MIELKVVSLDIVDSYKMVVQPSPRWREKEVPEIHIVDGDIYAREWMGC